METDFAKVTTDASGLAADMVRVRSERAEAWRSQCQCSCFLKRQNGMGLGSPGGRWKLDVTCGK